MDIASFPIWNEYIRFLKSADAVGSYAENQKIAWIRKVYQRAVVNPMLNIEQAWFVYYSVFLNINSSRVLVTSDASQAQRVFISIL